MIQAGKFTIEDNGFAVTMETIGGMSRQALVAELPGGISDAALSAFCTGPIAVLDQDGNVTQTHDGPFRIVSHSLKLTRSEAAEDVAALLARVSELEAALSHEQSEKNSALGELASLSQKLDALKVSVPGDSALVTEDAAGSV